MTTLRRANKDRDKTRVPVFNCPPKGEADTKIRGGDTHKENITIMATKKTEETFEVKRGWVIDALGDLGQLNPADLSARTGYTKPELVEIIKSLKADGLVEFAKGGLVGLTESAQADYDADHSAPEPVVAVKPSKPGKPSKPVPAPAAEPEEIEDLEYELDPDEAEPEIDLDALIVEYNTLQKKSKRTKAQEERYGELEEILDANGVFDDDPDSDEVEGSPEPDDEDEGLGGWDDDPETAEEGPEEPQEPEEVEVVKPPRPGKAKTETVPQPVPAKTKGQQQKAVPVEVSTTVGRAEFTMSYKPIDILTDDELEDRITMSVEMAGQLNAEGHIEVAEMLMRSVAKARKQQRRRS